MSNADAFERCIEAGGLVVFPADTVYGLACDPGSRFAVQRLCLLKRRPLSKPSAVMFFELERALAAVPELGQRTRQAMDRLLPGGVTVLVPNPARRFPLACGDDGATLGLRVPVSETLAGVRCGVLQSSANRAGGADPRRIDEVPELIRAAADLVIDGGELPGTPSTVVDLRHYEEGGIDACSIVRHGAVGEDQVAAALAGQFHFSPDTYDEFIRADVPDYDAMQDALVAASGSDGRSILELGTGAGETARRLLASHPDASLVGLDESEPMLAAARMALPAERVTLRVGRLQEPLPPGEFDLVASALCVHHLDGPEKADLFVRVRKALAPRGRFVLADVVVPERPSDATSPLTPGYDKPSTVAEQLRWLAAAGFTSRVVWEARDLAVIIATPNLAGIVGAGEH